MKLTGARVVLLVALALSAGTAVLAYNVYDPPRRWFGVPRLVTVDSRGINSVNDASHGVGAALTAAERWNYLGGGVIIDALPGSVVYAMLDGRSDVIFGDPLSICTGNCLAATTIGYYTTSQSMICTDRELYKIVDSDVCFNTTYDWTTVSETDGCFGEYFLEAVMTHEIGHLIGIAHSNNSTALMWPLIGSCFNKAIGLDDVDGTRALYYCPPPSGPGGGCEGPETLYLQGSPPKCKP